MQGMDILVLHPYGHPERNEVRDKISRIKTYYEQHLGRPIDLYVTEYGSATPPAGPQSNITEQIQAQRAVRSTLCFYAEDVKAIMPHTLSQPETSQTDKEKWYGYFRRDNQPKPGLIALANCARMIDGGKYLGDLFLKQEVGSMLFEKDGKTILACWTNDMKVDVQIPTGVPQVQLVDIVGKQTTMHCPEGKLALQLTADPIYLVGVSPQLVSQSRRGFAKNQFVEGIFVRNSRVAHRMPSPPIIDGVIDEPQWQNQRTLDLRLSKGDPTDVSARGYVAWDDTCLYVAADVTDDEPYYNKSDPASVYDGDSLELWVGSDVKYQIPEFIHSHDQQMFFAPTCANGQPVSGRVVIPNQKLAPITGSQVAYARTSKGWSVEIAIPLNYFQDFPAKVGHVAALEMRVNDKDTSHKRFKANPVDGNPSHFDATLWSLLILAE